MRKVVVLIVVMFHIYCTCQCGTPWEKTRGGRVEMEEDASCFVLFDFQKLEDREGYPSPIPSTALCCAPQHILTK